MRFLIGKALVNLLCAFCLLISFSSQSSALLSPLNDNTEFVNQGFRDFLYREAEANELDYWVYILDSGSMTRAEVVEQHLYSSEFEQKIAPFTRLYFAYLNRVPDYSGLMYWIGRYHDIPHHNIFILSFVSCSEPAAIYGDLNNSDFISLLYQNILGRIAEPGGFAYWTKRLETGTSRSDVVIGFTESEESKARIANEIYVAMTYIGLLRRAPKQGEFYYWVNLIKNGTPGLGLIDELLVSEEYEARFLDNDGDGFSVPQGDCNDSNSSVNPGVSEIIGNGIDDNCNGMIDEGFADSGLDACIEATGLPYEQILSLNCFNRSIVSLEGIQGLMNLTFLTLRNNQISDVTPLQTLTKLNYLHLGNNQISDVAPLQNLTKLTQLYLNNNYQISDVTPVQSLTNLTLLSLTFNQVSDLTPLQSLTNLNYLSLSINQISDVTPLQNLTNLTDLKLFSNQISDISPIQNLTNLLSLSLDDNQISDITPLQHLTNLRVLYLQQNCITDFSPISGLSIRNLSTLPQNTTCQ